MYRGSRLTVGHGWRQSAVQINKRIVDNRKWQKSVFYDLLRLDQRLAASSS